MPVNTEQSCARISADSAHTEAFEQLLTRRYSCRGFLPQPVDREKIEQIAKIAQRTASWCNAQPWTVIITRGEATERFRRAMLEAASAAGGDDDMPDFGFPRQYLGVYRTRRRECGLALYDAVGVAHGDRAASARQSMENFRLFGAPHVAIVTSAEPLGTYGALDCGAYVNNFMLAAASLGVASIAQAALARRPGFVRRHFGLPEDRVIVCGISFGYEDPEHPANQFRTGRADWPDAVRFLED